jgi:mannose-1-phosphate guanylyltransferase/phosphomannomutase
MAGGEGSRLRPLTIGRPKPMVPVVNKSVIGHLFDLLKHHGITEVIVTLRYMASFIQDYFDDGSSIGMKITYSIEEAPLGTAGSVKHAARYLDDTFIVISGDALTDFNLGEIVRVHKERRALASITLTRVTNPLEFGVIVTEPDGQITQFLEKPSWGEIISDTVNTGLYVLEPEVLDMIPDGTTYDFAGELFPEQQDAALWLCGQRLLVRRGQHQRIYARQRRRALWAHEAARTVGRRHRRQHLRGRECGNFAQRPAVWPDLSGQ